MASPQQHTPGFTESAGAEIFENKKDEADILADQDQTVPSDPLTQDENMGAKSMTLDASEEEPGDFMRGEVDVKEQMDRAADAIDSSIRGLSNQADEDSPRTEIGAAFRDTPGGLEEVEMRTDEELAHKRKPHNGKGSQTRH
jgi:hypothetical protein